MLHAPPVHLAAPSGASWFFTALCLTIFVGATVWAVIRAKRGDMLGLAVLAGGLAASLIEPMLDNLGLLWFGTDNHLIVFRAFGRSMPLFLVVGYGFYFGAITYFTVFSLQRGKSSRYLWAIYAFGWAFDLALESTGSWVGLYKYYGPQPYNPWSIPLWWMFVNPALPIASGGLFYVMRDRLQEVRSLLVVPLLPMCYGATYGAIAWPIFVALNSRVPGWVIWIAGAITAAFALLFVGLIVRGLQWYRERAEPASIATREPPRAEGPTQQRLAATATTR
ncbi:MAG: hypothetical protein QOI03_864 [Solirubrobacteraceae bacterium]|nr:hypothetical protein [Solirubrobacteraceae bacterium]